MFAMEKFSEQDEKYMRLSLKEAAKGRGKVSTNPMVGAVLVKNGKIIGRDFHRKFGGAHAEARILRQAERLGISLEGASLYLNLEPCVPFPDKKTPDCVSRILKTRILRVCVASVDPNPSVSGRGIQMLRRHGIVVSVGCLRIPAEKLNEVFFHWKKTGTPFVAMKVASSLDGKIATGIGESKWITSDISRKRVKSLRDEFDAILVGKNTVLCDDPELKGRKREPLRIILDSKLAIPEGARILRDRNILIVTTAGAPNSKILRFQKKQIPLKIFPKKIELAPLLRFIGSRGVSSLLVEGGSEVFGSFIDKKLVNRLYWFLSPKIIGGRDALPAIGGKGIGRLSSAAMLKNIKLEKIGDDFLFAGDF